jgi:hypothetical protein
MEKVLFLQAKKFLSKTNIYFVKPGIICEIDSEKIKVIFVAPKALDLNIVLVNPPDVRVWVYKKTGK